MSLMQSLSLVPRRTVTTLVAAGAMLLVTACAQVGGGRGTLDSMTGTETKQVTSYGMGLAQQRFSTLTQVNKSTVKDLVPVWATSLDNSTNTSTQPLVIDGVMYVVTHNSTVAIDTSTGRQMWKTQIDLPSDVAVMVCCGIQARGLAFQDGVIYRATLDAHLQAMDAKNGKILWRTQVADYKSGYSITAAPLVVRGVVITGMSGGEYNTRGFLRGYDARTGKLIWTRYTTAGPDDPGHSTWNGSDNWKTGGGSTWITGSYDPKLNLVYWGTGNGAPWNPMTRAKGGDALYIASVLAIRPETGDLIWHFQFSPADAFDYDSTEMVLADTVVDGKPVNAIINANRNGFFYILDRETGKLVAANRYAKKMTWASGIDMKTGRPIDTEMTMRFKSQEVMENFEQLWPTFSGAKNWAPMSYDPTRKLAFINGLNFGVNMKNVRQEPKLPAVYFGIAIQRPFVSPEDGNRGFLAAIDPTTGKYVWDIPFVVPHWSGVMSTAGGLVFTGNLLGEFMAFDSDTGAQLWKFQTGSGISSLPITWEKDGKQYISVTSGAATTYNANAGDKNLPPMPAGGTVWTFALH